MNSILLEMKFPTKRTTRLDLDQCLNKKLLSSIAARPTNKCDTGFLKSLALKGSSQSTGEHATHISSVDLFPSFRSAVKIQ